MGFRKNEFKKGREAMVCGGHQVKQTSNPGQLISPLKETEPSSLICREKVPAQRALVPASAEGFNFASVECKMPEDVSRRMEPVGIWTLSRVWAG